MLAGTASALQYPRRRRYRKFKRISMGVLSFIGQRVRVFPNITVHPTQEMRYPPANWFRGGPEWPDFQTQIFARHCLGRFPKPVDLEPHPALPDWPFFDTDRYLNPTYEPARRWHPQLPLRRVRGARSPEPPLDEVEAGFWCGPITSDFGVMIADYGMRIAASSRLDEITPLVFSVFPAADFAPPAFFWRMIDHLGIDRARVMLIRKPTRFGRLSVLPQAERRNGGGPSRDHLRLMDAIGAVRADRDYPVVFVSRSRLQRGNFAGEAYLDAAFAAAGATIFHPETADLHDQLRLYRGARRLIFSEGSALHALQLLGRVDTDIIVLTRRPRRRLVEASLRPRARSLRYIDAMRGLVFGLRDSGMPQRSRGISVLDEHRLIAALAALGIDLAPNWDSSAYTRRRDADLAGWLERRLAAPAHPNERRQIESTLAALSLRR
jgi:hypothetical protein